ncbi:Piso0_003154 [Millerozyma farinosa CBS 7064]|uniref:Signal recognition particle subunit SRP14 n=1 Tax=Pichia sorbitophila (strain ATCC MYA-4447 / BCRC 22081 / CBS 7064 / NBRC 10061 / NRRL Y-12695) TaxID=559304 RepID=G8YKH7_PICSO|nr:Piso0_003154 [Millerozyma farinosa CBS 7064]CCE80822.1 Piso0_003154 [Millerozyma farinosa CBS 7064]
MGRLNNKEFLNEVKSLLETNNGESSVYFTQKRLKPALALNETEGIDDLASNVVDSKIGSKNEQQYGILIRVAASSSDKSAGSKKTKLSTVVETNQLDEFWNDYAQVLKAGLTGLKKKEKKKSKKTGKVSK